MSLFLNIVAIQVNALLQVDVSRFEDRLLKNSGERFRIQLVAQCFTSSMLLK